jgi:hypothetical protein
MCWAIVGLGIFLGRFLILVLPQSRKREVGFHSTIYFTHIFWSNLKVELGTIQNFGAITNPATIHKSPLMIAPQVIIRV